MNVFSLVWATLTRPITDKFDEWFVDDWRNAHKWYVMHINGAGLAMSAIAQAFVPASSAAAWIGVFSVRSGLGLGSFIFLIAMIGRLLYQPNLANPNKEQRP